MADASELFYEKSNGARMIIKDQKHSVVVSREWCSKESFKPKNSCKKTKNLPSSWLGYAPYICSEASHAEFI